MGRCVSIVVEGDVLRVAGDPANSGVVEVRQAVPDVIQSGVQRAVAWATAYLRASCSAWKMLE
ncbi:hypothetical protein Pmar_PMAR027381 [Perkinsus marinus ATCC 50983]|uniref:Uncharacterized protein n=1 Tax=Perkinsus marinus (strain ATCC 50983 / TXsc) TaxID=423536 RepID=C5KSE9_PERM5|nr:hypothetical protein Pmar_PMAR027381 [Perkinsus marinus ATCC 50983]EER12563.1 hypothetical protein Pmar_PMAR027381 [Perkinsus marinus ATCC 50983]|eukprot:XP_002780768.1 hypothetical protein Pmar_PMAR027381 [Perkinsus marinus ATCC 50983]